MRIGERNTLWQGSWRGRAMSLECPVLTDASFSGGINPGVVSPRTYNKCFRSWIAEVYGLAPMYTGPGFGGVPARITIDWAGTLPNNATTCAASVVAGILYEERLGSIPGTGSGMGGSVPIFPAWVALGRKDSVGTWVNGLGCFLGAYFEGMEAGKSYRIAATARWPDNTTRKIRITTVAPLSVRANVRYRVNL